MANNKNSINDFRLPAEWEQQSGVQLTWPHANTDWKPYLEEITKVFIDMAKVITNEELLVVVTPEIDAVKNKLSKELTVQQMDNVIFSSLSEGMRTMDADIFRLVCEKRVSNETALLFAANPDQLKKKLGE